MSTSSRAMDAAITAVQRDFAALRTDRADPALIERVSVPAYGGQMPLAQLATIGVPAPRQLLVTVFDAGLAGAVERALSQADLGGAPQRDGTRIRIELPAPTQERRERLARDAKSIAERGRVAVRNARHDELGRLKRRVADGSLLQAQANARGKHLQEAVDEHVREIDRLLAAKLDALMG